MNSAALVLALAVALDLLAGDPVYPLHPVRLIGKLAAGAERVLRRAGLRGTVGGILLTVTMATAATAAYAAIRGGIARLLGGLSAAAAGGIDVFVLYSVIALRDMVAHARPVSRALAMHDTDTARRGLQRIVGRDVARLDEPGMARAAVESVAESFVDGFLAPLFWYTAAGTAAAAAGLPPAPAGVGAALLYRTVNTLDSRVGYRNERYRRFGTASARADDVLNFLPARLAPAILWIGARFLPGLDGRSGLRTARRDRLKHVSPNAGHAESFVAGALGLKLGGPTAYPGGTVAKPWLGDGGRPADGAAIEKACRLSLASGIAAAAAAILLLGFLEGAS